MGKRIDILLFPGGKKKALTLSYDDGVVQDRRLVGILDQYGLKATFNLGSGVLGYKGKMPINGKMVDISKVESKEVSTLYINHEIAGHGLWHSSLPDIGTSAAMYEIIEDKRQLEMLAGKLVRSFAYPFGTFNNEVRDLLHLAGYESARTVISSGKFDIPKDFLLWEATCHHSDPKLMELAQEFCESEHPFAPAQLFYLWGHAYEFDADDNWDVIENFARFMSDHRESIWFATNGEIVDYVNAFRQLKYSADASLLFNPSSTELWLRTPQKTVCILPGETVWIPDTGL